MTKRGLIILLVLVVIIAGAISGIIMFLNQQKAVEEAAEPAPAVTLGDNTERIQIADGRFFG